MTKNVRDLSFGMRGDDVLHLKVELLLLGAGKIVADASRVATHRGAAQPAFALDLFDAQTLEAVRQIQSKFKLPVSGVVDETTAAAIRAALEAGDACAVYGFVRSRGEPADGLVVTAGDRDMRSEQALGKAQTDLGGFYLIPYKTSAFAREEKLRADLVVRVHDGNGNRVLAASDILFNADRVRRLDLSVSADGIDGDCEYDRVLRQVQPLIGQVALSDLTKDDVAFLAGETGIPAERVRYLKLDAAYRQGGKFPAAVFYGLLRQGLPEDLRDLLAEKPSRIRDALKASVDARIVPAALGRDLDGILRSLQRMAVEAAYEASGEDRIAALGQAVRHSGVSRDLGAKFVEFSLAYEGDESAFWDEARKAVGLKEADAAALEFALVGNGLVYGHEKALAAIQEVKKQKGWTAARDLARMTRQDWQKLVAQTGHPKSFQTAKAYAEAISDRVERAFPTATIAARLEGDKEFGDADLTRFFAANPQFSLLDTQIDAFLGNGASLDGIGNLAATRDKLSTLQRVMRLAPETRRFEVMMPMIRQGFTSAVAIQMAGEQTFRARMAKTIGDETVTKVLANARLRAEAVQITHQRLRDYMADRPRVLPGITPDAEVEIPSWARQFGAVGGCACEHCRSMLSPAAYMVDMLQHLRETPGDARLLDALFERRPDIRHIELNCANTNVRLPYIDLVNEILEAAVAGGASVDWRRHQTSMRDGESQEDAEARLRAVPDHLLAAAYVPLRSAEHPWVLPFDPDHARARLLARHLGLDLAERRAAFGGSAADAALDRLGLSAAEWTLLTRPAAGVDARALWGVGALPELEAVPTFLRRSGLAYEDLLRLVESRFLSADGLAEVTIVLSDDPEADPCDLQSHRLQGLRTGAGRMDDRLLDQIHRFIRLRRALGWSVEALDAVLAEAGFAAIEEGALLAIARMLPLAERLGVSVAKLAATRGVALAALLGLTDGELSTFGALAGAGDPESLDLSRRLDLIERWLAFRDAGGNLREVAYVLLGRDQVPAAFAPADEDVRRFLRMLHAFVHERRAAEDLDDAAVSDLVIENLARQLDLAPPLCDRLLRPVTDPETGAELSPALMGAEADAGMPAISDVLRFVSIPAGDRVPDEAEPALYDHAARLMVRLDRAARLLRGLKMDRRMLDAVVATAGENGFLDLGGLRSPGDGGGAPGGLLDGWLALSGAVRLRDEMPGDGPDLFDLLAMAADSDTTLARLLATINAATGWSIDPATGATRRDPAGREIDVVEVLAAAMSIDRAGFRRVENYRRLHAAVRGMKRWRVGPDVLALWADPARRGVELADSLEAVARGRHADDRAWYETLAPLADELRELRRDALLAWLMHREGYERPSEVYARYLIDPEMSSCALTSRIVQANAAIQLFVQRIHLNLENDLRPDPAIAERWDAHWRQWDWMRNYRVWEANRKVFLYPENWLEPELRDDKSELFARLENALLQDEVNEATAERAFRGFLEGFRQIARLDVRGFHVERETDAAGVVLKHVLHVFARTFSQPHAYFHRQRDLRTGAWTAWRKIDANIEGDHLIPVVRHGQLMLFWPKFREVGDGSKAELTLSSSRYRDGAWQPMTIGSAKMVVPAQAPGDFTFRVDTDDDALRILVYRQYYSRTGGRPVVPESYSLCNRAFVYNACSDVLDVEPVWPVRMLVHPRRADAAGMLFGEEDGGGDELFLTDGSIEDDEVNFDPELFEELVRLFEEGGPGGTIFAGLFGGAIVLSELQGVQEQARPFPLLTVTPGRFSVVPAAQERQFTADQRFFFQDRERSFLVTPEWVPVVLDGRASISGLWGVGGLIVLAFRRYAVELFYHPYVCEIVERFDRDGIRGLLAPPSHGAGTSRRAILDRQYTPPAPSPLETYGPAPSVATPYPLESIDFRLADAFALYNWELFFHIPLLCAVRLSRNMRFEEAQRWFHYIFDPTDRSPHPDPAKFWRVKPFFDLAGETPETLGDLLRKIAAGDAEALKQVAIWRADPFNPHAIARCRLLAYMKAVVMAYLDNLFAWADHLFAQDGMESINEAFQIYMLAAEILGDRPVQVMRERPAPLTYAMLEEGGDHLDALSNAWVELESLLPADLGSIGESGDGPAVRLMPYFCVPANEKLLSYWDRLADRLFKIRNCMNISGQVRPLALFEPPIDPALLVRARAAGLDLRSVLDARRGGVPHYRYAVAYQKALQFCGEVRSLGQALLSANEKRDGEALSRIRNEHESAMLAQVEEIKKQRIDEARESLESLNRQRESAMLRLEYYRSREYRNAGERAQIDHLHTARGFEIAAQSVKVIAPILYSIPNVTVGLGAGTTYGGTHLGSAVSAAADGIGLVASQFTFEANLSSITGSHDRRRDDWQFQARLAEQEIAHLDKQILAAEIRLAIAENELDSHRLQARQAEEIGDFLDEKFSDVELYGWMQGQLAALHHQSYQMARDLALRAQAAAERELGLAPGELDVIGFEHWDGSRKGLLAGERLNRDLLRLDALFMERNRRSLEITKHVSTQMLDPVALAELKATGRCVLSVPEWLFDLDYPGQYNRRIKSVSLTIPCIAGPYTNVSCKLTLTGSRIRYRPNREPEPGPLMTQSIATSNAQNDSGVFEINFRDDRYLPFEGAGAISDWRLELSGKWQIDADGDGTPETVDLSQIDFDSISDVILHIRYTAQEAEDGGTLRRAAVSNLRALFASMRDTPLVRLFGPRHEFGSEWHRFLHPAGDEDGQTLALPFHLDRFPFAFRKGLAIQGVTLLLRIAEGHSDTHNAATLKVAIAEGDVAPDAATAEPADLASFGPWHGMLRADVPVAGGPGRWTLNAWLEGGGRVNPEAIADMAVIVRYRIGA